MPMMLFEQADPTHLRTYYEKRDLVERGHKYQLVDFEDRRLGAEDRRDDPDHGRGVPALRLWPLRVPARHRDRPLRLPRGQPPGQSLVAKGVRPLGEARRLEPGRADRDHPLRGPRPPWPARMAEPGFTIIVLAAQRGGRLDPLAAEAGVTHKCLVPIGGRPLLAHVLAALGARSRGSSRSAFRRARRRRAACARSSRPRACPRRSSRRPTISPTPSTPPPWERRGRS